MEYAQHIINIKLKQETFFKTQKTKDVSYRLAALKKLKHEITAREQNIYGAVKADFKKSEFETFLSELSLVISEIDLVLKNLNRWSKPKRVKKSILTFPSKDSIYKDPYGSVLIIAPWNYPFLLAIAPLVAAIAAGNTVVLKPSELTPNTAQLITEIIEAVFPNEYAVSIQGGVDIATKLLEQQWDYIFFTGSVPVGKIVAKAAAKHLTPVTLELGGKSPCIIDGTVKLALVARRLVWGKFLNGGQTCIAPDYLIVKSNIKQNLIEAIKTELQNAYGINPEASSDYPRIVNKKNTTRLINLLSDVNVIYGGDFNEEQRYIAPTLVDEPSMDSGLMSDEIFGPILPLLSYETEKDIEEIIWTYDKPLSLYVFSNNDAFVNHILKKYSFGGGAINDSLIHFGNDRLPFGGVGASGMGAYHGKFGYDTFSHHKSISRRGNWIDPPFRYAPYKGKLKFIKTMFKYFS